MQSLIGESTLIKHNTILCLNCYYNMEFLVQTQSTFVVAFMYSCSVQNNNLVFQEKLLMKLHQTLRIVCGYALLYVALNTERSLTNENLINLCFCKLLNVLWQSFTSDEKPFLCLCCVCNQHYMISVKKFAKKLFLLKVLVDFNYKLETLLTSFQFDFNEDEFSTSTATSILEMSPKKNPT